MVVMEIYTDGSCIRNPGGPGGWGFVVDKGEGYLREEYCGGEPSTTNNRMEIMGVLNAIQYVIDNTNQDVVSANIYTDSKYVQQSITEWINGWVTKGRLSECHENPVKNIDLWEKYLLMKKQLIIPVKYIWVKGHSGVELNEVADRLANKGMRQAIS